MSADEYKIVRNFVCDLNEGDQFLNRLPELGTSSWLSTRSPNSWSRTVRFCALIFN